MKEQEETKVIPTDVKNSIPVDFSKISVQLTFEGAPRIIDFRKPLGNAIRAAAGDIGLDEFARKIYFSEGPVEVPGEYFAFIKHVVKDKYNIPTQEAFEKLLTT